MMEEASRIKTLLAMNINYIENRTNLAALRKIIRERWWRKNAEKWSHLIDKVNLERHHKDFWNQVNGMPGRRTKENALTLKEENGREIKIEGRGGAGLQKKNGGDS